MFEVYLHGQVVDPRLRARFMVSAMLATVAVFMAGSTAIVLQRLDVQRVLAPEHADMLTLQVGFDAPPPPKPPPRPQSPDTASSSSPAAAASSALADPSPGPDILEPSSSEATPRPSGRSVPGLGVPGVPGNGPPGVPCVGPQCVPGIPGVPSGPGLGRPATPTKPEPQLEPITALRARAIFTPDPDPTALARTPTGLSSRRPGSVAVSLCVGPKGRVSKASVRRRFGDPKVDAIVLAAVKRWRFRPLMVGGRARSSCSEVTFRIEFDG